MRLGLGLGLSRQRAAGGAPAPTEYTARFGVGADQATGTGNFNTALYTGTTPADGTYGNFTVTSGVISCNGSQTAGTYDVGGWPVQVISGYKAVATQGEFDAVSVSDAGKTILVREAAALTVANTWRNGVDFGYMTILGDGADPRPTTVAGLADTSNDSRKHFVSWATYNQKKLIFDNLRFVTGSVVGSKVDALSITVSGGGNFCSDIYVLRSYFSCSRPTPNGDYTGGITTFPGGKGIFFSGDVRRVSVRDNVVSGAGSDPASIALNSVTGMWEVVGNWVDLFYLDGIRAPGAPGLFGGNLVSRPMATVTDTGAPHCDGTQFLNGQAVSEASAFITGDSRGAWQSHFAMDGSQSLTVRNILVSDNALYQISIEDPVGCQVANCTWVPKVGSSFPLSNPQGGIRYRGTATGTNDLLNSVYRASSSIIDASPAVTETGNVDAQSWVEADWDTNFPNWEIADVPTLQNALQVHAAPAGGGAAAGKGANQNITSWGAERSSYVLNVTTPTVSNITLTATVDGFTGTLRTDVGNNQVYWAVVPQADPTPSYRDIKEERVSGAVGYGSVWCSRANAGTDLAISCATASPGTAYKLCAVAENGWSVRSSVATSNFTTLAAGIQLEAVGTTAVAIATSINIPIPAGANGEYMVAIVNHRRGTAPSTPSGWNLIGDGTGWTTTAAEVIVFGRERDGTEGATLTVSHGSSGQLLGFIAAYSGVDAAATNSSNAEATATSSGTTSRATPTLTATADSCIIHIWGTSTGSSSTNLYTLPNPGDLVAEVYNGDGKWYLGAENQLSVSAGTTTARTATCTIGPNWNAMQVELLKA